MPSTVLEKPIELIIRNHARTHNRIRYPRLVAFGRWNNVGKGSRQSRSVISGEGLALGIGFKDPCSTNQAALNLFDADRRIVDLAWQ